MMITRISDISICLILIFSCTNRIELLESIEDNINLTHDTLNRGSSFKEDSIQSTKLNLEDTLIVFRKPINCNDLFDSLFFVEHGSIKHFNDNHWKGEFENQQIEVEYWSNSCIDQSCKIESKISCARSYYSYQNGFLVTYDSVNPKCERIYFFQKGMDESIVPDHVPLSLRN